MLEGPAVALAREVDPLGVPELVAHKVEVALAAEARRDEADELVQRDAAVDDWVARHLERAHVPVHLLVHQPAGKSTGK